MKKVLFVGSYPNAVNIYLRAFYKNLVEAIADRGYECHVIAPVSITKYRKRINDIPEYIEEYTLGGSKIRVYHPRFISYSAKKFGGIKTGILSERAFESAALKIASRLVQHNRFDFVYGHFFLTGGLAAIKIGKKYGLPSFVAFGECDYDSQVRIPYRELTLSDVDGLTGIISVSKKNTAELKTITVLKNTPVLTAPNSIDASLFFPRDKQTCRKQLGLNESQFIVGFVGGFIERKGDKRLLEALNRIPNVYGAFVGKGEIPPSGEKVIYVNHLPHELIPVFLNAIDVFCLPTLSEGSCNAVIEAGACGIPIISSNLPFNDDILTDENSIRVEPNSVDEIEWAIRELYDNEKLRKQLSTNILNSAEPFEIGKRAERIIHFINSVVSNNYDGENV